VAFPAPISGLVIRYSYLPYAPFEGIQREFIAALKVRAAHTVRRR